MYQFELLAQDNKMKSNEPQGTIDNHYLTTIDTTSLFKPRVIKTQIKNLSNLQTGTYANDNYASEPELFNKRQSEIIFEKTKLTLLSQ